MTSPNKSGSKQYFIGSPLYSIPSWKMELLTTGLSALLYFILSVVQLAYWSAHPRYNKYSANIAAGVFGFFNILAYLAGSYFLYREHMSSSIR